MKANHITCNELDSRMKAAYLFLQRIGKKLYGSQSIQKIQKDFWFQK